MASHYYVGHYKRIAYFDDTNTAAIIDETINETIQDNESIRIRGDVIDRVALSTNAIFLQFNGITDELYYYRYIGGDNLIGQHHEASEITIGEFGLNQYISFDTTIRYHNNKISVYSTTAAYPVGSKMLLNGSLYDDIPLFNQIRIFSRNEATGKIEFGWNRIGSETALLVR